MGGWSLEDPATGLILARCLGEARAAGVREMLCLARLPLEGFYAAQGFSTLRRMETRIGPEHVLASLLMRRGLDS